eukprot:scaffold65148_cov35-Prasinocladus_malaysianus.AAC.1
MARGVRWGAVVHPLVRALSDGAVACAGKDRHPAGAAAARSCEMCFRSSRLLKVQSSNCVDVYRYTCSD